MQCDLSWQQLQWQEFLFQYDMMIVYIPREDNTVANALSQVCNGVFPGEMTDCTSLSWDSHRINVTLSITTNTSILWEIQDGYQNNKFCKKIMDPSFRMKEISSTNGSWYIGDRLIIPHTNICEELF